MSKRIVIVGSSHVAALKVAWTEFKDEFPGIELDFFASHLFYFRRLLVDDTGVLSAPDLTYFDPGVTEDVGTHLMRLNDVVRYDLNQADMIALCDFPTRSQEPPAQFSPVYRPLLQLLFDYDIDGLRETGNPRLLGARSFDAMIQAQAAEFSLPDHWLQDNKPPMIAVCPPMPSETLLKAQPPEVFFRLKALLRNPQGCEEAVKMYLGHLQATLAKQGVPLVVPPQEVLNGAGFVREAYNASPIGVTHEGRAFDPLHMNVAYGRVMLKQVVAKARQLGHI